MFNQRGKTFHFIGKTTKFSDFMDKINLNFLNFKTLV